MNTATTSCPGRNTVIFDLDGTLLDTLDDLTDSVNHALLQFGCQPRTRSEVRRMVGNGVRRLMEEAVPGGSTHPHFEECLSYFSSYYKEHMLDFTKPYPGIYELLSALCSEGYKLAIVSNKFDAAVKGLNKKFFSAFITTAIGESPEVRKKPAPDSVLRALNELHSDPKHAIYVGDSDVDILTSKNAGIPCICVSWGFKDTDFLISHGAQQIVSDTAGLLCAIRALASDKRQRNPSAEDI